ncbi:MAG: hypothetical protein FJ397_09265 [Verrucomicrobia bacterium]|nr:hypothetical protein [Verrucomicrobiota bacterium]
MTAPEPLTPTPSTRRIRRLRLAAAALPVVAFAAEPAPPLPAAASTGPVVELSPFTVDATRDTGYAALETTSGTRMRTALRDLAAPLSVITAEFLQDLAATSPVEALLFTPSVDTVEGDPTRHNGFLRFGDGQPMAIRGFVNNEGSVAGASDTFRSFIAGDVYNTERITLSRGPNSLLFGVGGADGLTESTTKRARFDRRITQVQYRYDTWDSHRVSLDHNQPLLGARFAVRVNALFDRRREFRDFEGSNQKRVTLGVTARPLPDTRLSVNREDYRVDRNIVPLTWAYDNGAMQWIAKGRPTVDFSPTGAITAAQKAAFDPRNALGQVNGQSVIYVQGLGLAEPIVNWRHQFNLNRHQFNGALATEVHTRDPFSLFGIAKETNLQGGTWDDPSDQSRGSTTQAFVEQRLGRDLYLEVAGSWMRNDRDFSPSSFDRVTVDPNRFWVDGRPNPGFLQPYGESANNQYREYRQRRDAYRASVWYELDLAGRRRWLGQHQLSFLAQTTGTSSRQDTMRWLNRGTVGIANWNADPLNAVNAIAIRTYYVGGRPTYPVPDATFVGRNLAALAAQRQIVSKVAAGVGPLDLALRPFVAPTLTREEIDSVSVGWQGRWLERRLVTLVGWRRDATANYIGEPPYREWADPAVPNSTTSELRRYYSLARQVPFRTSPEVDVSADTMTFGAVLTPLAWLALTYNQSENFTPSTNPSQVTFLGERPGNQSGAARDFGLRLYGFEGRFSLALSRFANSQRNQIRGGGAYVGFSRGILQRLRDNYSQDSRFTALPPSGLLPIDPAQTVATDWNFDATGYEATAVFNTRRWRVSLTGSLNENVLGEHLLGLGKYLYTPRPFEGLETWRRFAAELRRIEAGQASPQFDLNPQNPAHRLQAGEDARYLENQANGAERQYLDERALEGQATNWSGKYALNAVVAHDFEARGPLGGWSVGANFRWRSAGIAGYARALNAAGVPEGLIDVSRPIPGDSFAEAGAMLRYQHRLRRGPTVRVQLNVQNLLDAQDVRLVKVGTDTEAVLGPPYAPVGISYALRRPRNFILTTTLDF